jgi:hypothetical protein
MATKEKTNRAVERLAESTRDSYQTVVDHAVGLQERNVRFAQGMVDGTIKELRHQAESNRSGPRLRTLHLLQGGPGGREEGHQVKRSYQARCFWGGLSGPLLSFRFF